METYLILLLMVTLLSILIQFINAAIFKIGGVGIMIELNTIVSFFTFIQLILILLLVYDYFK